LVFLKYGVNARRFSDDPTRALHVEFASICRSIPLEVLSSTLLLD